MSKKYEYNWVCNQVITAFKPCIGELLGQILSELRCNAIHELAKA